MKFIPYLFLLLILSSLVIASPGQNVGVDSILESVGIEKPADWSTWNKMQKYSYLQGMGIYPDSGGKYRGDANIQGFFTWLGVDKPDNWESISFDEKKSFVDSILDNKNSNVDSSSDVVDIDESIKLSKFNLYFSKLKSEFSNIYFIIIFIFSLLMMATSFLKPRNEFKSFIRKGIYYLFPIFLLYFSLMNLNREFFAYLGVWAQRLLIFIVFIKPISVIFKSTLFMRAVSYRRETGVASFWLFVFHIVGLIYVLDLTHVSNYLRAFMVFGFFAGLGMFALGLTSNTRSVKYFKKNWKKIQYLTYPVFFLVLAHSGLFANGTYTRLIVVGGIYLILKTLEYLKKKKYF